MRGCCDEIAKITDKLRRDFQKRIITSSWVDNLMVSVVALCAPKSNDETPGRDDTGEETGWQMGWLARNEPHHYSWPWNARK